MKWTIAFTALVAALFISAPVVESSGTELIIGFFEWLNDLLVQIDEACADSSLGPLCGIAGVSGLECGPFPALSTCSDDDTPAQSNWPASLGIAPNNIDLLGELDGLVGTAIDAILASSYINDEPACQAALTTYTCKLVFGMVGAASGCNGGEDDYKSDLPCQDDCVNFMRKCFVGAKDDFIDLLQSEDYCLDISDLNLPGFESFCPFQIDSVSDGIVDFLSNDVEFCEKLGHEDDDECTTINLRQQLADVSEPIPFWIYIIAGLVGLAVIAGIGFAVSKKNAAAGDKFDDSKSSNSEFSQASEATRADF